MFFVREDIQRLLSDDCLTHNGVSASDGTRFNMRKSLCMAGRVDAARNAYQAAAVRTARSTRESYTLSGWAKGVRRRSPHA